MQIYHKNHVFNYVIYLERPFYECCMDVQYSCTCYKGYYSFQVSILPPLASIFVTGTAAQLADNLIANGVETTTVWRL